MTTTIGRQWSIFYAYTAWTVVGVLVLLPLGIAAFTDLAVFASFAAHPVVGVLLCAQVALGAWSGWRAMRNWSQAATPARRGRWDLPQVGRLSMDWSLLVTAVPSPVIAAMVLTDQGDPRQLLVSLALLLASTFMRWHWWLAVVPAGALSAVALALGLAPPAASICWGLPVTAVLTVRSSLWLAAVVRELDEARQAQAQLAVAEERLRFARDLHDVTGRDLSVIAVKAELVAQLADREDPRAVEHGREVAQIARTSLAEIRALVRSYREADLATELRGTVSLLRSAHVEVSVVGGADDVPPAHSATAAWVLREGGTNILRHADPTTVTITLGGGIRLVNDGSREAGAVNEGAGLTGMRERLDATSTLTARREDGTFTLDVRFDPSGEPR